MTVEEGVNFLELSMNEFAQHSKQSQKLLLGYLQIGEKTQPFGRREYKDKADGSINRKKQNNLN